MRSMHQVLLKQKRLQVASEGGTVEIRVLQFIRQWVPSCWHSHGKGTTTIRVQLEPWGDEQVVAGWTEMLSFSDLSDRHAQLRQVVGRLAVKTLVYHPAKLVRDPICHIEPVQLSMKELFQTAVVLPCAAHDSRASKHLLMPCTPLWRLGSVHAYSATWLVHGSSFDRMPFPTLLTEKHPKFPVIIKTSVHVKYSWKHVPCSWNMNMECSCSMNIHGTCSCSTWTCGTCSWTTWTCGSWKPQKLLVFV